MAIRSWVIRERAGRAIEVGLGYGTSALFVCGGLLAFSSPDDAVVGGLVEHHG